MGFDHVPGGVGPARPIGGRLASMRWGAALTSPGEAQGEHPLHVPGQSHEAPLAADGVEYQGWMVRRRPGRGEALVQGGMMMLPARGDQWLDLCSLAERDVRRAEIAAVGQPCFWPAEFRGQARRPNRKSHVPACGSKTPPWRSHTPRCPAEPQGGKRLSQSHDSSWSSRKGPDHRSPRPQTAPGVSSAATRPPTEVTEIRFHGRSGGNCSSIAHQSITGSALPRVYPTPPRRVKSDRLLEVGTPPTGIALPGYGDF